MADTGEPDSEVNRLRLSFRRNLGSRDRGIRALLGLTAFLLAVFRSGVITRPVSIVLLVIGIPLIVEAIAATESSWICWVGQPGTAG